MNFCQKQPYVLCSNTKYHQHLNSKKKWIKKLQHKKLTTYHYYHLYLLLYFTTTTITRIKNKNKKHKQFL